MGDRIVDTGGNLIAAALILTLLVILSGAFLVILALVYVVKGLLGGQGESSDRSTQAVGLFGAPASPWWLEQYDRWLWRVEDALHVNLTKTPAQLFAGAMILAGVSGILFAGAGYLVLGPASFWPILIGAVMVNGLSAWWLSRPLTSMFGPALGNGSGLGGTAGGSGFVIGEPLE